MDSEQDSTNEELPELLETESASAGDRLRSAREARRLDLEHISAETRIPVRHLQSIEAGTYDDLPSRTYAIGFSRNYAKAVGLDEKSIADAVREELADNYERHSAMAGGMEPGDPAKLPSAGLAWFGGAAAIILAIGVISYFGSYFSAGGELPSLMAEEEPEEALAEAPVQTSAGGDAAPANPGDPVVFTALEDGIWVRFYEDGGERLFEAQMSQGDRFELPQDAVEPRINTGRPDAFAITIGGREVPKLSNEPVTIGDTPVSAAALLARADTPAGAPSNN